MTLFDLKDKYQRIALNHWHHKKCIGTIECSTGVGKTRMSILAIEWVIKTIENPKILILTPRETIRDIVFPQEFKKWNLEHLLPKIEIQCIQTAYKRKNEKFELIIADEFHNFLSEHYSLFFNNKCEKILGLSAFIPLDRYAIINSIAPICYKITTDFAVKIGLISGYIEYNIPIELTEKEKIYFNDVQTKYDEAEEALGGSLVAYENAIYYKKLLSNKPLYMQNTNDINSLKYAKQYWKAMMDRKKFLYNCKSKLIAVRKLIDELDLKQSIIFSQSTKFADEICKNRKDIYPFHTNIKNKETKENNLSDFLIGINNINHLSTCKCVEEGIDLPSLPVIINTSRVSSPKSHIQKRGRCLRYEDNKTSFIFNLYIKNSQDEKWLRSAQSTTDTKRIKWVSNIEEVKQDILTNYS